MNDDDKIDWSLTTWDGSRREQLHRWSQLTLEEILQAQEEMADLADELAVRRSQSQTPTASRNKSAAYGE